MPVQEHSAMKSSGCWKPTEGNCSALLCVARPAVGGRRVWVKGEKPSSLSQALVKLQPGTCAAASKWVIPGERGACLSPLPALGRVLEEAPQNERFQKESKSEAKLRVGASPDSSMLCHEGSLGGPEKAPPPHGRVCISTGKSYRIGPSAYS